MESIDAQLEKPHNYLHVKLSSCRCHHEAGECMRHSGTAFLTRLASLGGP